MMSGIELPKISLVTTCFNQLPLLRECIASVVRQNYPGLEFIVIDRGSSDGSREYLRQSSEPGLCVYEEADLGQVEAVDKGLALASGDIMGLLDPEDKHFHLGLFKTALVFLNDWKVNWVAGRQACWLPTGNYEEHEFHAWNIRSLLSVYQGVNKSFPQSATFWRRALYDLVGAKFGPGRGDDAALDLWLRFYEHVELHSADTLIASFRRRADIDPDWQAANRAVIQRSQVRVDKANRRTTSPSSLRCSIDPGDFLRLLRETRPGYADVGGVRLFQGESAKQKNPPLLLCYGLPKSASSFTWKIASNMAGGDEQQYFISRQLPPRLQRQFMNPVDERCLTIVELLPPGVTYVLKTHGEISQSVRALVMAGVAKAVISVRDPYDLVASLMDVGVSERARPAQDQRAEFTSIHTFEDALHYTLAFLPGCREWLEFAGQHNFPVIHFERVKNQPATIATQIAGLLGVTVDADAVVEPLVRNKSENIPEFNVGISGRGRRLFENYQNQAVTRELDDFNTLISKFV